MSRLSRRRQFCGLALLLFGPLCILFVGQTPTSAGEPQPATQASTASSVPSASTSVRLGAGDLIELNVFGAPDLTTKTRISNSGDVYLPLIDYVHIGDLTVDEAQELIEKRLEDGGFVRNPHVTILVDESMSQAITVMGEVSHPGAYPAIGERRLFDMISAAGGRTDKASNDVTIVHRANPDDKVVLELPTNLAEDTRNNVEIRPGDTIIVGRAGIVYVIGDVQRPSGFMISEGTLTVLKAFALAGGGTRTSSLNRAKILRQTANGVQEVPVPLKKILRTKAPDIAMVKGDILYVPGSATKTLAYRGADAAFTMTSALAVIAVHP